MRITVWWLWLALAALAFVALMVMAHAQDKGGGDTPTVEALAEKPVVTAIPYKYETEYELDPFEPEKLRRTKTTVTHVLVVRADGTTSVKPAQ
jgi:hypothetical protein